MLGLLRPSRRWLGLITLTVAGAAIVAPVLAQDTAPVARSETVAPSLRDAPTTATAPSAPARVFPSPTTRPVHASTEPAARLGSGVLERRCLALWPTLDGATLGWFAVIVILALSLRLRPLICLRNLDALILAATCLLLLLRADTGRAGLPGWAGAFTGQWWSYLLLSAAAGYWLLRGVRNLVARSIPRHEANVSDNAMLIFVLAGLAIGIHHIARDPLSPGSRDGIAGGVYLRDVGKLPYGEVLGHDSRSPLLYILHAGAERILPSGWVDEDDLITMTWPEHETWLGEEWWHEGDFAGARLVNATLFVLLALALYATGRRLHSPGIGLTLLAILCVFPGAVECFTRPEMLLPATVLTWALCCALVPGIGGLLSCLLIVLAGLAWPWAWLALPVLLGYFFRHGWHSIGGLLGTLGGTAAGLAGLAWLVAPTLPRADGALERAGLPPAYDVARSADGKALVITPRAPTSAAPPGWLSRGWAFLIDRETEVLDTAAVGRDVSPVRFEDIDARKLLYQNLDPRSDARPELTRRYRAALSQRPLATRLWVAIRTVLEQTWSVAPPAADLTPGTWALWSETAPPTGRWPLIHKLSKLAAGLLALLIGLLMLRGRKPRPHHLAGGLLAVTAATLLADAGGAAHNLIWLAPMVLTLWAANEQPAAPQSAARLESLRGIDVGLPPRISVER